MELIGYPHAGNDVFHVKGIYQQEEIEAYIKVARQLGADIENGNLCRKCCLLGQRKKQHLIFMVMPVITALIKLHLSNG